MKEYPLVAKSRYPVLPDKSINPCSSCRSGTAGPDGDGEGANQTPSPSGSSIEICEGPHGHHFRHQQLGSCRAAAVVCGNTHRAVKKVVDIEADPAGVPPSPRAARSHNYDAVAALVAERLVKSQGRISAKRLLPIVRAAGSEGSGRNSRRLATGVKCCVAVQIIQGVARRCGRRASIW